MRIIATTLLLGLLVQTAWSQREVSISSNLVLIQEYQTERAGQPLESAEFQGQSKANCDEPEVEAISVLADSTLQLTVEIDTTGLDTNGVYACLNCGPLNFGVASLTESKLSYTANGGIGAGLDTVQVFYCNSDNSACSDTIPYVFLARRPGNNLFPAPIVLTAAEQMTVNGPEADLPGALKCSFFVACPDNYDGRDQLAYFTDYSGPTPDFVYQASRFRGVDSLCLVLCDEFGICDTTHYAFRIEVPAMGIPLMDDFSYDGPRPDAELWLDREIFVNRTMAVDPPSIGVATFDGVDFRGRPYGGDYDEADRLTSTYINLQGQAQTPVLSFWLQRGGIADRPEVKDSLVLEFRDDDLEWQYVTAFEGMPGNQPITVLDTFRFYSFQIPTEFRHNAFQFRFINYADRQGIRDNWHLDYIRLDDEQIEQAINDVAFTSLPELILANYSSMPWRHFQATDENELRPTLRVGVYNHANQTLNASPSAVNFRELNSNVQPFVATPTLFNGLDINIPNGVPVNREYDLMGDPSGFPSVWGDYVQVMEGPAFDAFDELTFEMRYSLNNTTQLNQAGFEAIQANDEVVNTTEFSDYFAYDDGTAESGVETSAGNEVALAFVAGVPDTMRGVRIHFPHTGEDFTEQSFRLKVWLGELDDSPEYNVIYQPDYASNYFDTLQGFTTYPLVDADGNLAPLAIPEGMFYVGWEQAVNCDNGRCIAVGYDRNRPQGRDFIFVNNGGEWESLAGITSGSLMLRPVVSGAEPVLPTNTAEQTALALRLFPNPAQGQVYLQLPGDSSWEGSVTIYNMNGQLLRRFPLQQRIDISALPAGMYLLEVTDRGLNKTARRKLVVQ